MKLALFDLDGTLTPRDTEDEWAQLLGRRGLIDPAPQKEFNAAYHRGELDLDAYFEWYATLLTAHPLETYAPLRDELVREVMVPSVPPVARGWVEQARASCDVVLLVSASNSFLTTPIGAALGLDATLGTDYAVVNGAFTGDRTGIACFREGKVTKVQDWLAGRGQRLSDVEHSTFYSDSHNDLPLLELVDRARTVDPDPILLREALARGWDRLSLGPEL